MKEEYKGTTKLYSRCTEVEAVVLANGEYPTASLPLHINTVSQAFYGTLNGRISFQKGHGQIDFWVRNALDKEYASFYFESMGNGFMQKGRPVQAGIELRCRF